MKSRRFHWPLATVGVAMTLSGCMGYVTSYTQPNTEPYIVLQPGAAARAMAPGPIRLNAGAPLAIAAPAIAAPPVTAAPLPTPASRPALSPEEKEQLFKEFHNAQAQATRGQAVQTAAPRDLLP